MLVLLNVTSVWEKARHHARAAQQILFESIDVRDELHVGADLNQLHVAFEKWIVVGLAVAAD